MSYTTISRFLLVALATIATVTARADDLSDALAACSGYRDALLSKNVEAAWSSIDQKTQEYYVTLAKKALGASREEIRKQDIITKLMILRCRVEFNKYAIAKMSGRELFAEGVSRGWISRASAESLKGLVAVSANPSSAILALPSQPKTPVIYMTKQANGWKVELWRSFEAGNQSLKMVAQQNELTEDEFVIEMLKAASEGKFDGNLWDAPANRTSKQAAPSDGDKSPN